MADLKNHFNTEAVFVLDEEDTGTRGHRRTRDGTCDRDDSAVLYCLLEPPVSF